MGCLFGYCGRPAAGLVAAMAQLLAHRCAGGWEHESLSTGDNQITEIGRGIALWNAHSGPQVAVASGSDLIVGYSGVLFNAGELSGDNGVEGTAVQGLLPALESDPETIVGRLDGAFIMAVGRGAELFLVRDPAGAKVLYWTVTKERLVFASEVKALFADPAVSRRMRIAALPEYLTFSFVPGTGTMFENVEELQPGHTLRFAGSTCRVRRHFVFEDCEYQGENGTRTERYVESVRSALESSVRRACAVVAEPPAVFLSGGIDSSGVLAVAARQHSTKRLKTFSVHFGSRYANENEFISLMVDRYHTDHTWLEVRPSGFLDRMRRIIWTLDEPIGDPITVPNYLLSQAASRVTHVVLNGEGGDPCFGGPKNIPMILSHLYGPFNGEHADSWLERDYLRSYRKCYDDLQEILDPQVLRESGGEEALVELIRPFFRAATPRSFLNKLMTINIRRKGANLILVKVDKMTSANGILALAPLFSKQAIRASMECPPWLKLDGNIEKAVLKRAVQDIVPQPIVDRPKSGMMVPVKFWFRGDMRRYAQRVLSTKSLKRTGMFNVDHALKLLDYDLADLRGQRYGTKLWMLMTFMLWHEQMVEHSPVPRDIGASEDRKPFWKGLITSRLAVK